MALVVLIVVVDRAPQVVDLVALEVVKEAAADVKVLVEVLVPVLVGNK